ncbi:unnamed protein product [Echinostoma caproni]|uniref:Uncharacterized protein n=1 Tax=Echinostoma caproni TaxID=27848 RepID=A0A183B995_9TREM|nr:unnamed protein product [Echinostoma caproni]
MRKQSVSQLQQLIADSGVATATSLPFFSQDQFRAMVSGSVDGVPLSESRESSRHYHTMGSEYSRSNSARLPPGETGEISSFVIQTTGRPPKLPFQPNWLYERPTLWDDFLPPKKPELKVSLFSFCQK